MRTIILVLLILLQMYATLEQDDKWWTDFKEKNNRIYLSTEQEAERKLICRGNLDKIKAFNNDTGEDTLVLNYFGDVSAEEFGAIWGSPQPDNADVISRMNQFMKSDINKPEATPTDLLVSGVPPPASPESVVPWDEEGDEDASDNWWDKNRFLQTSSIPASWDWRREGAVSGIKSQGNCGSCWAFATTAVLESLRVIKLHLPLVDLSPQFILNCGKEGQQGCGGGRPDVALNFVQKNGIGSEEKFPYMESDKESCASFNVTANRVKVQYLPSKDAESIKDAVYNLGPVIVVVNSDWKRFPIWQYANKVIDHEECPPDGNHVIVVVGYGMDNGNLYFTCKNSWSERWGDQGYIKIYVNANANNGLGTCGILQMPMVAIWES